MTVIVYTKPNCPPCAAVKRLLTAEGIAFEERNAEDYLDYLRDLGARGAPVIVEGDRVIHGFVPDQLKALNQ